jgi:DNA-binding NarL/FixJ family response regulator
MRDSWEKEFCPENGFEVVGSIDSAADTEVLCFMNRPALIITDVCTMSGASGLDAVARIREKYPEVKIIVTSGFDEITYAPRARELGAHAFIYKTQSTRVFRETALRVLAGERVFPEPKSIPMPQGEAPFTDREMEILRLLCKSFTTEQIAKELFITEATLKYHKSNMLAKSGFTKTPELVIYVISNGWINPNY